MSKHTPEPWKTVGYWIESKPSGQKLACMESSRFGMFGPRLDITLKEARANAVRIIQCVNACAGMENPAEEIQAMREELKRLTKENRSIMIELQCQLDSDGAEIAKLSADKARLVEFVCEVATYEGDVQSTWHRIKAKQLITEMESPK